MFSTISHPLATALAVLAMVPLIIVGYLIQSHLARGMTFGAIKK